VRYNPTTHFFCQTLGFSTQKKIQFIPLLPEVSCFDWEFYGGAFDDQCAAIFEDLKDFCSRKHLSLHMTGLTRTLLGYSKSSEYPTATFGKTW
jgi:hypothetical protein